MRGERETRSLAFLLALTRGARGRYALSRELGLSEGILRGLYRQLESRGLIRVGRGGAQLTESGRREILRLLSEQGVKAALVLEEVEAWGRRFGGVAAALEGRVEQVVEARDEAVRAGAYMALVVEKVGGKFVLPLVEGYDLQAGAPQLYEILSLLPEADSYLVVLGDRLYPCVKGLLSALANVKALRRSSPL